MHIMLIGGGGFIGRALTQNFLNSDNFVITWCTARDVSKPRDNIHIVNDLLERSTHEQDALLMDVDVVFYLASNTTPSTGATDLAHEIEINLLPFSRYLTALIRQPNLRLIYLSSGGSIYDPANPLPATESAALCAQSCYASGKIAMETFLTNAYRHRPTDLMILRPSNVYGPGQPYKSSFGFIRSALQCILDGREITLWGDGKTVRDYLFIDDFTTFCHLALSLEWPDTIYNIGSGKGSSLIDICDVVESVTEQSLARAHSPETTPAVRHNILNVSHVNHDFGWQAQVTLTQGIAKTWEWLRSR